jgi:hypothetical protein
MRKLPRIREQGQAQDKRTMDIPEGRYGKLIGVIKCIAGEVTPTRGW